MSFAEFRAGFAASLAAAPSPLDRYELIAARVGEYFGVTMDEVALFSYDHDREVLVFIWPKSLKTVGSIPLIAHKCLVSKTAVEKRAVLDNSFATSPHLYMFEHFLSDRAKRIPIQKIMSVPIMDATGLKGVIQVARKGADRQGAGADFTAGNLQDLGGFASLIAAYL
jgi:hypothetical protein